MHRKKLPIGIQTFRKMREDDYYYVDKTPLALRLIEEGSHFFLSRPRRFGKSLFLDMLGELFAGSEALFQGLYVRIPRHSAMHSTLIRPPIPGVFGRAVGAKRRWFLEVTECWL